MQINGRRRIDRWRRRHAAARKPLMRWKRMIEEADWRSASDVAATFGRSVDRVPMDGGVCWVFNIGGNKFRLIAAIDFELQEVTPRLFLTHAEYDKDRWKDQ